MKKIYFLIITITVTYSINAQKYPEPEFSNEVYYLKKDSINSVTRMEKNVSKMENKTKMGGLGGSESGFEMDGTKSTVRFINGTNLSLKAPAQMHHFMKWELRDRSV